MQKKCLSLRGDINCAVSLPEITLEPLNQVTRGMGLPPEDWQIRRSSWPSLKGPMIALPEMSLPSAVDTVKFLGSAVNTIQTLYYRYVICLKRSEGGRRLTERSVFKFFCHVIFANVKLRHFLVIFKHCVIVSQNEFFPEVPRMWKPQFVGLSFRLLASDSIIDKNAWNYYRRLH